MGMELQRKFSSAQLKSKKPLLELDLYIPRGRGIFLPHFPLLYLHPILLFFGVLQPINQKSAAHPNISVRRGLDLAYLLAKGALLLVLVEHCDIVQVELALQIETWNTHTQNVRFSQKVPAKRSTSQEERGNL